MLRELLLQHLRNTHFLFIAMSLCMNCNTAFQSGLFKEGPTVRVQHRSTAEYLDAVDDNCHICRRFHYRLLSSTERELLLKLQRYEDRPQPISVTSEDCSISDSEEEPDKSWLFRLDFEIYMRGLLDKKPQLRIRMQGNRNYANELELTKVDGGRIFGGNAHATFVNMMDRGSEARHGHMFLPAWNGTGQFESFSRSTL